MIVTEVYNVYDTSMRHVYYKQKLLSSEAEQGRGKLEKGQNASGLLKPWGQYIRTDTDGKLKGGAGADGKSKEGR